MDFLDERLIRIASICIDVAYKSDIPGRHDVPTYNIPLVRIAGKVPGHSRRQLDLIGRVIHSGQISAQHFISIGTTELH